jgi:protein phosphatase
MGKVRTNNEDNFWCCNIFLEAENSGLEEVRAECVSLFGMPLLAVFDGMGGESCGEMASYLSAKTCGDVYRQKKWFYRRHPEELLEEICKDMNQAVCAYGKENKVNSMGSTAALLLLSGEGAYACNLGDSRIYHYRDRQFRRVSTDHVLGGSMFGKAPLTQYVGVPKEIMQLEPSMVRLDLKEGDRYLLCSDGLTDMLSDGEISDILSRDSSVKETVELFKDRALQKGGRDNITIILCEVRQRENENGFLQWMHTLVRNWQRGMQNEQSDEGSGL